ncbi:MAG: hypothetical protein KDA57_17015 [Planctomycetales bacterium]|nr:hypothetical protein [Planctomycetales bacterium]
MSVAKTKSSNKPCAAEILLQGFVNSAAQEGESFDTVERSVFCSVLEIGKSAMALFVSLQGHGDLGPSVNTEDDKRVVHVHDPLYFRHP